MLFAIPANFLLETAGEPMNSGIHMLIETGDPLCPQILFPEAVDKE